MVGKLIRVLAVVSLVLAVGVGSTVQAAETRTAPKKATAKKSSANTKPTTKSQALPKLLDLGATKCVPCKMMAPILEELAKEYKGQLDVEFIDVWKDQSAAGKYKVQSIPTQIFYDAKGKEFFRHVGFFPKEDILKTFEKQGIKIKKPAEPKKPAKK